MGDTLLGAGTGTISNLGGRAGWTSPVLGFGAGAANSLGGDGINNHSLTKTDFAWAALDGSIGTGENMIEGGLSNASPSTDATVGNSWGIGLSGVQGLLCGGLDNHEHSNC